MEVAKFVFTAVCTFISVFVLLRGILQHRMKKQDEKFEAHENLLKHSVQKEAEALKNSIQKETEARKESLAGMEERVKTLETTISSSVVTRLAHIEGELKGIKPILLSIQNWFINNTGSK